MPRSRSPLPFATRRRWTADDARAALGALDASGLSARAFARREGLDAQRLHRWRRQLAGEAAVAALAPAVAAPAFVEVKPRRAELVEIVLLSGRIVRVSESIDVAALERIANALDRGVPC